MTTAFLLYLPPAIWFLPLAALAGMCLLFYRRALLVALLLGALAFLQLFGWRWSGSERPLVKNAASAASDGSLSILTYNRGQRGRTSLRPFMHAQDPDLVVLQVASNQASGYLKAEGYEAYPHARSIGEFTLLSRYAILGEGLLEFDAGDRMRGFAARFEIDWQGTKVAVYAVHLPTPRDLLLWYRKGAFLYGVLGFPGSPLAARRARYEEFWDGQIAMTEQLLEAIREDPLPALVAGDFNAPSLGYIQKLLSRELVDAHEEAGGGSGFTFPGYTRNPLSLGGPWMRLDYLFASGDWTAEWCQTESGRRSQHQAVAAGFRLHAK